MQLWIITKLLQNKSENDDVELWFKGGFFAKKKVIIITIIKMMDLMLMLILLCWVMEPRKPQLSLQQRMLSQPFMIIFSHM